jgi:hypothetical protein
MNRLALPPTGIFIGHHVLIGTSMGMGCLCRNNALAPLIPSLRAVWLALTSEKMSTPYARLGAPMIRPSKDQYRQGLAEARADAKENGDAAN